VHLRRALLLFAVVLGTSALVFSIAPAPREKGADEAPEPVPSPGERERALPRRVSFADGASRRRPETRVRRGEHVVVEVRAGRPGEAALEGLGLLQPVGPRTPALFDLLASRPGRYAVTFTPVAGRPAPLGTLVVAE
jgi:hypothetical protein